ncbi:MAG: PEGA domain-containing protein [Kiritimatiellae bacterium]|nr:PEGA domain-containing protein [Kiritimatiellia bacterium]
MRTAVAAILLSVGLAWLAAPALGQVETAGPQLRITTDPDMADVTFDGALQGQTPLTLSDAAPGAHLVRITKPGFRDILRSVDLAPGQRIALNLAMEPVTGLVLVHSKPSGAEVEIDGAHRGATPLLLTDLPVGRYRVHFALTGYLERDVDLVIEDRTPLYLATDLTSDSATLTLNSTPPGATVVLNGIAKGSTPCTIERVPAGESELEVTLYGYHPFKRTIRLVAGQTENMTAALEGVPATLNIISVPPGARIYLDDEYKGTAPVTVDDLGPGAYRLRAEQKGYDTLTRPVTLARAQKRTEEMRLVSNAGSLEVMTHPPGVKVLVDGKDRGVTLANDKNDESLISAPLKIDLVDVGERKIQLVREGFFGKTVTVTVKRQQTTPLQESLKRRFIPDTEIKTPQGVFKGVFIDEDVAGKVRLEIRPGVIKSIKADDIVSREPIKK